MDIEEPAGKANTTKSNGTWTRRIWGAIPWLFLLLLIGIILLLVVRIGSKQAAINTQKVQALKNKRPDVNVVTLEMIPSPIYDRISLPGVVTPWVKLDILAEVRGRIVDKRVEEGRTVRKGEVIAVIDSRD